MKIDRIQEINQKVFNDGIKSIEIAFSLIEFAYRVQILRSGGIQELFCTDLEVKNTVLKGKNLTAQEVEHFFLNLINGVLCPFWVAIDEAFDKALGKKNPTRDSEIDDFRAIIYMFRCAFSHGISEPKWYVTNPAYRRRPYRLSIPPECRCGGVEEFYFDFNELNGQNLKTEAFKHCRGVTTLSRMACWLLKKEAQAGNQQSADDLTPILK